MTSVFAWLDHSGPERRRMLELVGLFREQGTVDELGIGTIRDALADTLFPGTSTLHTRPRYLLFIPWIYQRIERDRVPSARVEERLERDELRLIGALEAGGEGEGVIGIEARTRWRWARRRSRLGAGGSRSLYSWQFPASRVARAAAGRPRLAR